jgi:hypothetical protein
MEKVKVYFLILFVLTLLACNEDSNKQSWINSTMDSIPEATPDDANLREKIFQERIQSGDTLIKSLSELQSLLPLSFKGYELEDTSAQYLEFDNRRMSEARISWSKNEESVVVSLIDYNRNLQTWNGLSDMYRSQFVQDNAEELSCAWKAGLGENFGWINFLKEEPHLKISLGMAYRYLLTIEFTDRKDTAGIYNLIHQYDWSKIK